MNILLADDHLLFRESLNIVLSLAFPGSAVTHAANWTEVLTAIKSKQYDLLLLDLFMPKGDDEGWESCLEKVVKQQRGAICVISASKNRVHIKQAYEIGVNGYICKTYSLTKVQEVMKMLMSGKDYRSSLLSFAFDEQRKVGDGFVKITHRQQEVLGLLAEGESNKLIGRKLGLTESTVKRHLYNIYRLLDARNRADVIRIAKDKGLLN